MTKDEVDGGLRAKSYGLMDKRRNGGRLNDKIKWPEVAAGALFVRLFQSCFFFRSIRLSGSGVFKLAPTAATDLHCGAAGSLKNRRR